MTAHGSNAKTGWLLKGIIFSDAASICADKLSMSISVTLFYFGNRYVVSLMSLFPYHSCIHHLAFHT